MFESLAAFRGSGLIDQSQKMTVSARAMAEKKLNRNESKFSFEVDSKHFCKMSDISALETELV